MKARIIIIAVLLGLLGLTFYTGHTYQRETANMLDTLLADDARVQLVSHELDKKWLGSHETLVLHLQLFDDTALKITNINESWYLPGWVRFSSDTRLALVEPDGRTLDIHQRFDIPPIKMTGHASWSGLRARGSWLPQSYMVDGNNLEVGALDFDMRYRYSGEMQAGLRAESLSISDARASLLFDTLSFSSGQSGHPPWIESQSVLSIDSIAYRDTSVDAELQGLRWEQQSRLSPQELYSRTQLSTEALLAADVHAGATLMDMETQNINGQAFVDLVAAIESLDDEPDENQLQAVLRPADTLLAGSPAIHLNTLRYDIGEFSDSVTGFVRFDGTNLPPGFSEALFMDDMQWPMMLERLQMKFNFSDATAMGLTMFGLLDLPMVMIRQDERQTLVLEQGQLFFNDHLIRDYRL